MNGAPEWALTTRKTSRQSIGIAIKTEAIVNHLLALFGSPSSSISDRNARKRGISS
jgi:hypothetical protein